MSITEWDDIADPLMQDMHQLAREYQALLNTLALDVFRLVERYYYECRADFETRTRRDGSTVVGSVSSSGEAMDVDRDREADEAMDVDYDDGFPFSHIPRRDRTQRPPARHHHLPLHPHLSFPLTYPHVLGHYAHHELTMAGKVPITPWTPASLYLDSSAGGVGVKEVCS